MHATRVLERSLTVVTVLMTVVALSTGCGADGADGEIAATAGPLATRSDELDVPALLDTPSAAPAAPRAARTVEYCPASSRAVVRPAPALVPFIRVCWWASGTVDVVNISPAVVVVEPPAGSLAYRTAPTGTLAQAAFASRLDPLHTSRHGFRYLAPDGGSVRITSAGSPANVLVRVDPALSRELYVARIAAAWAQTKVTSRHTQLAQSVARCATEIQESVGFADVPTASMGTAFIDAVQAGRACRSLINTVKEQADEAVPRGSRLGAEIRKFLSSSRASVVDDALELLRRASTLL